MALDKPRFLRRMDPNKPQKTTYAGMHLWRSSLNFEDAETSEREPGFNDGCPDSPAVHLQYGNQAGYDDFHKAFLKYSNSSPPGNFPLYGPPRVRQGRNGGSWRHLRMALEPDGKRQVFIDGRVAIEDRAIQSRIPMGTLLTKDVTKNETDTAACDLHPPQQTVVRTVRYPTPAMMREKRRARPTTQRAMEYDNFLLTR